MWYGGKGWTFVECILMYIYVFLLLSCTSPPSLTDCGHVRPSYPTLPRYCEGGGGLWQCAELGSITHCLAEESSASRVRLPTWLFEMLLRRMYFDYFYQCHKIKTVCLRSWRTKFQSFFSFFRVDFQIIGNNPVPASAALFFIHNLSI
jgi:hypothetical protein